MSYHKRIIVVGLIIAVFTLAASGAETAPEQGSGSLPFADWGYILRGVLFIFASSMAMVWIGRKISRRPK